jgi:hypothetical protein
MTRVDYRQQSRYKAAMKLRHAAALALTGWYLIAPPIHRSLSGPPYISFDAETQNPTDPLSRWDVFGSYDSASNCEDHRLAHWKHFRPDQISPDARKRLQAMTAFFAKCIATGDPRLKGK